MEFYLGEAGWEVDSKCAGWRGHNQKLKTRRTPRPRRPRRIAFFWGKKNCARKSTNWREQDLKREKP